MSLTTRAGDPGIIRELSGRARRPRGRPRGRAVSARAPPRGRCAARAMGGETAACRANPLLHGCRGWSDAEVDSDPPPPAEQRGSETLLALQALLPQDWPSIVIVGLVSLGIVLNVLRRGHNGLRATLRRPVGDVAREAAGILTRISAGEALVYGSIGLIGFMLRPDVVFWGLGLLGANRTYNLLDRLVEGAQSERRPSITPHGTIHGDGEGESRVDGADASAGAVRDAARDAAEARAPAPQAANGSARAGSARPRRRSSRRGARSVRTPSLSPPGGPSAGMDGDGSDSWRAGPARRRTRSNTQRVD